MAERGSRHLEQVGGSMPPNLVKRFGETVRNAEPDLPKDYENLLLPAELLFFIPLLAGSTSAALRLEAQSRTGGGAIQPELTADFGYAENWAKNVSDLEQFQFKKGQKAYIFRVKVANGSPQTATNVVEFVLESLSVSKEAKRLKNCEVKSVLSLDPETGVSKIIFAFVTKEVVSETSQTPVAGNQDNSSINILPNVDNVDGDQE